MKALCIIGIGSPSGDDQAGWQVIDALQGRLPPEIALVKLDRPGLGLIRLFEQANDVILIDAMHGGGLPGEIRLLVDNQWEGYEQGVSSHGLGVFAALNLAREMGCLPASIKLYGIEIDAVWPGESPSAPVMTAVQALARRIVHDLYRDQLMPGAA